uniref:Lysosomal Pro-X carboxypeptidase n=1 Tax=Panagrolaimus superbus TaxID=310955 RepID=A0A914YXF1_9BILA
MFWWKQILIEINLIVLIAAKYPEYNEGYSLSVPVDHFAYTISDTFKIRYFYNLTFYKPNGPIFFYPGNEGSLEVFAENTGIIWDLAPKFNAAVIFIEHRYWGKSLPYSDESFTALSRIGHMTSIQTIADFAIILPWFKQIYNISQDSKIIAIGGSYGGMLAAWMKLKYPTLIHGVWASSAPVVWFNGGGTPLGGYGSRVQKAFKFFGCNNSTILFDGFNAISNLGKDDQGRQKLTNIFNINPKTPLNSENDVKKLLTFVQTAIENLAMTNYPYPTSFLTSLPAWPVKVACSFILQSPANPSTEELATLMKNISKIYFATNLTCLDAMICGNPENPKLADVWDFQKCTEIIIELCPMGPPNDFFPMLCNDRESFLKTRKQFCSNNYKHIGWTDNLMRENAIQETYGWDFTQTSNIIFTDGTIDPWGAGGVTNNTPGIMDGQKRQIFNFIIEGSAHHLDLRQPSSCDPENIKNIRYQIVQILKTWIDPSLPPYSSTALPPFAFPNVTDCEYLYNQYPWNQK